MAKGARPKTALVLAGGGARGAYDAGVIHYLRNEVASELGVQPRLDIICGTSVGAINACFLAASAHQPEIQGDHLIRIWGELRIEDVFRLPISHLLAVPRWLLGGSKSRMSLLRAEPLERLVTRECEWGRIRRNIREGRLDALTISATEIDTGLVVVWIEGAKERVARFRAGPHTVARSTRIGPRHALASAAIPLVFPAVHLGDHLYADGGLRQNTPLLPAVSLGAQRVLVVTLRFGGDTDTFPIADGNGPYYPSAAFLFGKVLNALLIDHVEHDLDRLRDLNALLDEAEERFGSEFVDKLGELHSPLFGTRFKRVDELCLRPGRDIGIIAHDHLEQAAKTAGRLAGRMLRAIGSESGDDDLASYLLFHGPYSKDLIALAREDCAKVHDQLCTFFEPGDHPGDDPGRPM